VRTGGVSHHGSPNKCLPSVANSQRRRLQCGEASAIFLKRHVSTSKLGLLNPFDRKVTYALKNREKVVHLSSMYELQSSVRKAFKTVVVPSSQPEDTGQQSVISLLTNATKFNSIVSSNS
jgi:hypothetical protein